VSGFLADSHEEPEQKGVTFPPSSLLTNRKKREKKALYTYNVDRNKPKYSNTFLVFFFGKNRGREREYDLFLLGEGREQNLSGLSREYVEVKIESVKSSIGKKGGLSPFYV